MKDLATRFATYTGSALEEEAHRTINAKLCPDSPHPICSIVQLSCNVITPPVLYVGYVPKYRIASPKLSKSHVCVDFGVFVFKIQADNNSRHALTAKGAFFWFVAKHWKVNYEIVLGFGVFK